MNARQYSFIELSKKTVVNVADGKELGNACDLIFNGCGTIGGLVVPGKKSFLMVSSGVFSLKADESQNDEPYSPGQ